MCDPNEMHVINSTVQTCFIDELEWEFLNWMKKACNYTIGKRKLEAYLTFSSIESDATNPYQHPLENITSESDKIQTHPIYSYFYKWLAYSHKETLKKKPGSSDHMYTDSIHGKSMV